MDTSPIHQWAANDIHTRSSVHWVEAQCREDKPARQLSAVIVAGDASRRIVVQRRHLANPMLRLPRCACEGIQIWNVIAWLIALRILPYHAANRSEEHTSEL